MLYKNNNVIFVSIMLMSVSCVKSLKTGYNTIENDIGQLKLLKCSYLFYDIFNMKVYKLNLKHSKYSVNFATKLLEKYERIVRRQMHTLVDVRYFELRSLYILNMYLSDLKNVVFKLKNLKTDSDLYQNMLNVLDYVIEILNKDTENCPEGSQFDINDSMIEEIRNIGGMPNIYSLQNQKKKELKSLFKENGQIFDEKEAKEKMLIFSKDFLFMRRLMEHNTKNHLLQIYNVQVFWNDTFEKIEIYYIESKNFLWSNNNFQDVKRYYYAVFSFLKIIMLRLTWKHLLYLKYQRISNFKEFVEKWNVILNLFKSTIKLKEDLMIDTLCKKLEWYSVYLANTIYSTDPQTILNYHENYINTLIVNIIMPFLHTLCEGLGCNATIEPVLNGNESELYNYYSFNSKPNHDVGNYKTINYHSILYAHDFINYINCYCFAKSRDIIYAFTSYIEELSKLNPFNCI